MKPEMIIIAVVLAIIVTAGGIYVNGFKSWLVWAVAEAETLFGGGTGKLKLRYAYELAISRFPTIAKLIPFSVFSAMVDGALVIMREMIENNGKIANVIKREEIVAVKEETAAQPSE